MKISIGHLEEMFTRKPKLSFLVGTFFAYSKLKKRVDNAKNESWYFQRGIESQIRRLKFLKSDFNDFVEFYNNTTIDDFLARIAERAPKIEDYLQRVERGDIMNWITRSFYNSLMNQTDFDRSLIALKAKLDSLHEIDYYLDHPEDLLPLWD